MSDPDRAKSDHLRRLGEEDAVLVLETIQGNEAAASKLFRRYVAQIYSFVLARVGQDRLLAEDLTQEVFFEAWRNLSRFETGSRFPAWLVGIARRKLARHFRRALHHSEVCSSAVLDHLTGKDPGPGKELETEETTLAVTRVLASLPAEARDLLLMKYRDGMKTKRIAELLHISPEAVNSRLQRARKAFKDALGEEGGAG